MRRINLFSYGMMSLLKLFARVLVIVLAVSLFQQAHSAQAAPARPPHFDRRAMPEALAAPVRSPKGDAAKPAPDWRFYVLEYHNFTENASQAADYTMTVSALRRDLDFLRDNGYTTVLPRELAAGQLDDGPPLPQKAVLLTFDDGYESNYTLAFPILREYGAKAAISLITSRIEKILQRGFFMAKKFYAVRAGRKTGVFLTWDECREMAKSGLVEFASHTNDCHIRPDASGIERKSGEDEETYISRISADLQTSITRIELETGQNVTTFTYPLGKMELWAEPFLQQHFAVTLSGVYGTARYGDSLYHLPRYNITDLHPASEYLPAS